MASSLSDTIRQWIQTFTGLFRRKEGLQSLSLDDVRREKILLERSERKILRELERLEQEKNKLFEAAKQATSQVIRLSLARKIQGVDLHITQLQQTLKPLGARISVLDHLESQYELGRFAQGTSEVVDALRATDAQELQKQIDESLAQDILQNQKVDEMLETFKESMEKEAEDYDSEEGLQAILAEIEHAAQVDAGAEEEALLREEEPPSASSQAMPE